MVSLKLTVFVAQFLIQLDIPISTFCISYSEVSLSPVILGRTFSSEGSRYFPLRSLGLIDEDSQLFAIWFSAVHLAVNSGS